MGCTIKKQVVPRIFLAKNKNIGSFLVKKCKKGILKKFGSNSLVLLSHSICHSLSYNKSFILQQAVQSDCLQK